MMRWSSRTDPTLNINEPAARRGQAWDLAGRARRLTLSALAGSLMVTGAQMFSLNEGPAQAASRCPRQTDGIPFAWQGAAPASLTNHDDASDFHAQTFAIGSSRQRVTMTVRIERTRTPEARTPQTTSTTPSVTGDGINSTGGISTAAPGGAQPGSINFDIGDSHAESGLTLSIGFDTPVIIRDFVVGKIDARGFHPRLNGIDSSFQDHLEVQTMHDNREVPVDLRPDGTGWTTISGRTVRARYAAGVDGDSRRSDSHGSVAIHTASPVTHLNLRYTNGALAANSTATATGYSATPSAVSAAATAPGAAGRVELSRPSLRQNISLSGFTICLTPAHTDTKDSARRSFPSTPVKVGFAGKSPAKFTSDISAASASGISQKARALAKETPSLPRFAAKNILPDEARKTRTWVERFAQPDENWIEGSTHGRLRVAFGGYGTVGVTNQQMRLSPTAASRPDKTHAALVLADAPSNDTNLTVRMTSVAQLRTGSPPNTWEVGWVVWNYVANNEFWYFIPKPNGWELGRVDPIVGQVFVATGNDPVTTIGQSRLLNVRHVRDHIMITMDDQPIVDLRRVEAKKTNVVGFYTEDATVDFDDISVG